MKKESEQSLLQQQEFRLWLQEEFSRRCRANPNYSLRAFAKKLGIHSATLSQILSGKRRVSEKMMNLLFNKVSEKSPGIEPYSKFRLLSLDAFAAISDWYHYAIMDMTLLADFKSDPEWIAAKLDITPLEAQSAVERLLRLEMLRRRGNTLILAKPTNTSYIEGQTSHAHKKYQRQIITKALHAVDDCPQPQKDITSITIATNSKRMKQAKEKIKHFRRELCEFLENGEKDSVYQMAIQLYPLTKF